MISMVLVVAGLWLMVTLLPVVLVLVSALFIVGTSGAKGMEHCDRFHNAYGRHPSHRHPDSPGIFCPSDESH
jgi:hypothetical protein